MPILDANTASYEEQNASDNEPKVSVKAEILILNIASGETASTKTDMRGKLPTHIGLPSTFTGTALTFKSAGLDGVYQAVYNADGDAISLTVVAGRYYQLPTSLWGLRYIQVIAGSAQAADVTLYLTIS